MKLTIINPQKNNVGQVDLPAQFSEEYRPDLIRRAVHALQSAARQRQGADPEAGFRHSSKLTKRRRKYRGCYGLGISRVNRKIMSRRGTRFGWVGTFSPQTVGGRRSHPPKSSQDREQQINVKENRKAIRSALAATISSLLVQKRGHRVPREYPFAIDSSFEALSKTKELYKALTGLGFEQELERGAQRKVRAGLGKNRGRKYKGKKSLLIVTASDCPLLKAARNVPGVDVVSVRSLNAELLAPGALPGRATLWTDNAIKMLQEHKLFI